MDVLPNIVLKYAWTCMWTCHFRIPSTIFDWYSVNITFQKLYFLLQLVSPFTLLILGLFWHVYMPSSVKNQSWVILFLKEKNPYSGELVHCLHRGWRGPSPFWFWFQFRFRFRSAELLPSIFCSFFFANLLAGKCNRAIRGLGTRDFWSKPLTQTNPAIRFQMTLGATRQYNKQNHRIKHPFDVNY